MVRPPSNHFRGVTKMIRLALAFLLTAMPLPALPVSFVWDVPDAEQVELVEGYRMYTRIIGEDGPVYLLQATIVGDVYEWAGEAQPGEVWILRSFNSSGESPDSAPVTIPKLPAAPQGFKKIVLKVQSSSDLEVWDDHAKLLVSATDANKFFRLTIHPEHSF
jgi:hypothetical protein